MAKPVVLTRMSPDWLLRIVGELKQLANEIGRGDPDTASQPALTRHAKLTRIAMELEPLAISYVEADRLRSP